MKWLYAAYRKGAFEAMPRDMDPKRFREKVEEDMAGFHFAYVLTSRTGRGETPIGLMVGFISGHRMEPHVFWFPWASARNRIETMANFFNEMRRMWLILIWCREKDWPFFTHLMRYAILDRVGKVPSFYSAGEDAMLFRSREP